MGQHLYIEFSFWMGECMCLKISENGHEEHIWKLIGSTIVLLPTLTKQYHRLKKHNWHRYVLIFYPMWSISYGLPLLFQGTSEVLRISPTPDFLAMWPKLVIVSVYSTVLGDFLGEVSISYHVYSAASL